MEDSSEPISARDPTEAAEARPSFDSLHTVLRRAVAKICPAELLPQQEDIVQTAALRVLELTQREENRVRSASYLWRVAFTTVIDEIRRLRRRREMSLEQIEEAQPNGDGAHPSAVIARPELGRAIRGCLERIAESRRLAVALHLHGFRTGEVAHILGWAVKRAENLTYRGLSDLRRCLASKGFLP